MTWPMPYRQLMTTPIFLVGEAWGVDEEKLQTPFVGASGIELVRLLAKAGVIALTPQDQIAIQSYWNTRDGLYTKSIWQRHQDQVYLTNVFQLHPPQNNLEWFCGPKSMGLPGYPALVKSKYVRQEFAAQIGRLKQEVLNQKPNLVICLGNTALWAFTGKTGIKHLRGYVCLSTHTVEGVKLLPTYHPAWLLRGQWDSKPTVIADLMKAKNEAATQTIQRPTREIQINPSISDIKDFIAKHVDGCGLLSVDIETSKDRITCIGFAPSGQIAIVIPFDDARKPSGSYWVTKELECEAWRFVKSVLENETIPKLFQNGLYDIAFLWRSMRIKTFGAKEDSMLLSHSLHPEMLKGLEYLGSVYSDEQAWKEMRKPGFKKGA